MVSRGDLLKEFFECDEVQQSGLGGGDCSNRDAIKFIFIATLGRMPNEGEEWDYHANDLEEKGFEAKCDEFCGCPEFETYLHDNTEEDAKMGDADDLSVGRYLVQNVFRNVLRRGYTKAEYEFHAGRIDEEEITPVQFCKEIIDCPEFESLGVDKSPENLVRLFCRVFLGRLANDGDVEYHAPRIADGMEPEDLATEFVECDEAKANYETFEERKTYPGFVRLEHKNEFFLQNIFHGILARGPNKEEFFFHLERLNEYN